MQLGHTSAVNDIDISPSQKQLVSSAVDGSIIIWEIKTGRELRRLVRHSGDVSVHFSPDGKNIITFKQFDFFIRVWDSTSGKMLSEDNLKKYWFFRTFSATHQGLSRSATLDNLFQRCQRLKTLTSVKKPEEPLLINGSNHGEIKIFETQRIS